MSLDEKVQRACNRLAKWRSVFAGWQLGTRPKGDPECDAVRDHREATIMLRAEVSALTGLLIKEGIFTQEDFQRAIIDETELLNKDYERRFPGMQATDDGILYDRRAIETMKHWKV